MMNVRKSLRLAQRAVGIHVETEQQPKYGPLRRTTDTGDKQADRVETASADRFTLFEKLPTELRYEIWEAASGSTFASASSVCIFSLGPKDSAGFSTTHEPLIVHEPRNSALMQTNMEAREITLRQRTRDFNPDVDILYLDPEGFRFFTDQLCGRCGLPWATSVRHLAIDLSLGDSGLWLPYALEHMPALETLSVVYPKTSGVVDCFAQVTQPSWKGTGLRQFTEEEMASLTIKADFVYDTWHSPIPIVWQKSVKEHLMMVEEQLKRNCNTGGANRVTPIWDGEAKRLKLEYRAMCFANLAGKPEAHNDKD